MDIRNTSELKACAVRRLRDAGQEKRIAAIYAAVTLGLSVLVALVNLVLDSQIAGTTGLGGLGRRTTLSSLQTLLPWVVMRDHVSGSGLSGGDAPGGPGTVRHASDFAAGL